MQHNKICTGVSLDDIYRYVNEHWCSFVSCLQQVVQNENIGEESIKRLLKKIEKPEAPELLL